VDNENSLQSAPLKVDVKIGFFGAFASSTLENAFREMHFRDDLWWSRFLVAAGMIRVALMLLADYQNFGLSETFELLAIVRFVFLLISSGVLVALQRAASPTEARRLLFGWGFLAIGITFCAFWSRDSNHNGLLMASFSPVLVAYLLLPLPLVRQTMLAATYSAAVFFAARHADGHLLAKVGALHGMVHLFGTVASRRSNYRRRIVFLAVLGEAELRARLETAMAEVRTLRGMVHMCAWCKRIRDEAQSWETLELYVQKHTHAVFTHGICPECLKVELARPHDRSYESNHPAHSPSPKGSIRGVADLGTA
jgi:hypothetical protein